MDYEQYLYGRAARDAAPGAVRKPRHARIGSLVAAAVMALGIVASVVLIAGKVNGGGGGEPSVASDMAVSPPPVVALAASEPGTPPHRE